ncbi:hypothetical protein MNBD_PLANCTO02-374 [hydrothermal vent metagenome]|uniref:Inverse autotransporter beta-domain domain-containing protein n=1 Tax=hydrothermal vent metagenome TaxID=652676 RepID=A0A3B1E6G4_9ZZZZ
MKCIFSQLCCGLLSLVTLFSLSGKLQAEDIPNSEGVVRTINLSDESANHNDGVAHANEDNDGVAHAEPVPHSSPSYVETRVDDIFRRTPQRALRYAHGPRWDAYTAWSFKPGNERVMGDGQVMVPLWQNGTSMLFADVRGQIDDTGAYEGNWGLGFRQIRNDNWILGVYGFFDRRKTRNDNYFSQATFGIEALTVEWEARANVYIPDSAPKAVGGSALGPRALIFNGGVIIRQGGGIIEQALYGVDAEVGKLFYEWGPDVELRGFLSVFHFNTQNRGFANISGARGRAELRMYDLNFLGEGSRLNIGAELQWDEVRNTQATAMLRVQIPLGRKQSNHTRLQRRMLDRIVRDVDIVSTQKSLATSDEEATDVLTGRSFGNVTVVDASTPDIPTTVLTNAVAGAGGPSTVIISDRKGQINTTASIVMGQFQNIIGSGYSQAVVGAVTGTNAVLVVPGSRPNISAPGLNAVILADDTTVRGLGFIASSNSIYSAVAVNRVVVDQNTFTGATVTGSGIRLLTGAFSGNITGNVATGIGGDGIWVNGFDAAGTFNGILGGRFSGNSAISNGLDGIHIGSFSAGTLIFNNISNQNGLNGYFATNAGGTATNNTGFGNGSGNNTLP